MKGQTGHYQVTRDIAVLLKRSHNGKFDGVGAPIILQSDNGREFANRIIKNLAEMWPGLKLVHGKPRHSQNQRFVGRSNQDERLADQHTTKWSEGLRFVQSNKNCSLHTGIIKSPYEAMFGVPEKIGLMHSSIPEKLLSNIETEQELQSCAVRIIQTKINVQFVTYLVYLMKQIERVNRKLHVTDVYELRKWLSFRTQDVGRTVIVRVPDRGILAPRNVLAVVLSINDSGLYQLGIL
ncbi:KRAB-A domain-containing protein 2-like [Cylas formicarius]|uniref:KRAB-A domain-containing protein 2-like n=1 Tax=Cylas formicarius TaxID=197179 RepID=UPI00295856DD|nr:KRAB-A domain-containing protein 2-like [Cylas formicarius]